ncbi:hypothetical protein LSTR_LSTR003842 [Laodelphax striatellus]|uniref:MATH domain-containing protein n=1 Tax=Laodelphax striatellus TaxID=195883 RepID=A0A482XES8_LAOST|nr:hypothetical protein LSTR_LSTR003842 [Laodelphax striatellus]
MALLYRFVKLQDRAQSHVFTFVVTKSVTRDLERDVTSKEFSCGHQRWAITFSRTDKVVGVYLVWKTTSEAMRVYVDFTFTLLNREHFSVNEAFSGKQGLPLESLMDIRKISLGSLQRTRLNVCCDVLWKLLNQT